MTRRVGWKRLFKAIACVNVLRQMMEFDIFRQSTMFNLWKSLLIHMHYKKQMVSPVKADWNTKHRGKINWVDVALFWQYTFFRPILMCALSPHGNVPKPINWKLKFQKRKCDFVVRICECENKVKALRWYVLNEIIKRKTTEHFRKETKKRWDKLCAYVSMWAWTCVCVFIRKCLTECQ